MFKRILFAMAFVLLCAAEARAVEYKSYFLHKNETVSHASLFLTRNANNWNKAQVINPKTGGLYSPEQFRRLPVGTEVRFAVERSEKIRRALGDQAFARYSTLRDAVETPRTTLSWGGSR